MQHLHDNQLIARVESSASQLIDQLDLDHPDVELMELKDIAEVIETEITSHLVRVVIENAPILFSMTSSSDRLHLISSRGELFQVISSCNVSKPNQLVICLNAVSGHQEKRREFVIDIDSYGKYAEVVLMYPARVAFDLNYLLIRYWFKTIFESGYHWFFQIAGKTTNIRLADLSKRLYEYSKKYIADELRSNLWFSAIADGYGFRLIDEEVAKQSFKIFKANNPSLNYSTNRFVSELLSTYLPENIMLMRKAIDGGQCIDVNLADALYKKQGSIYALTMTALYGCESFTVYPIHKGDRLSVGAVFDSENKAVIQPILDAHKDSLAAICLEHTGDVKSLKKGPSRRAVTALYESLLLEPNFFGVGMNVKRLLSSLVKRE